MKKIILFQEGTEPLHLIDDSDEENTSYATKLSFLLELPHISLLELSHSITIVRPSKVVSINISEVKDTKSEELVRENKKSNIKDDVIRE